MARLQDMAFNSASPVLKVIRRELGLVMKFDMAPYSTSRFGRRLKEACWIYASSMEPNDPLLAPLMSKICEDLHCDPNNFEHVKQRILDWSQKKGRKDSLEFNMNRWDALVDGLSVLLERLEGEFRSVSPTFFSPFLLLLLLLLLKACDYIP